MDGQLVKMLTKKSGCVSRKLKHCTFFQSSMIHSFCIQFGCETSVVIGWMLEALCNSGQVWWLRHPEIDIYIYNYIYIY